MIEDQKFFDVPTIELAQNLLGKILVKEMDGKITSGIIVETEAYLKNDPASHSFSRRTKRNVVMFEKPGLAYVYFTYGMYYCFNITSGKKGDGEAVLIRALEPVKGLDIMIKRRRIDILQKLCNGPAKLAIAMGIDKNDYGKNLITNNIYLEMNTCEEKIEIIKTTRIGIKKGLELPYRFYIKGNIFVSKR